MYLKLQDGDSVKLRIASDPAISSKEFTNQETGEVSVSTRYAWTIWNRNEDKAQVFEAGKSIFNQLADLIEEWGEPTSFDVTIKRTGSGLTDTRYSVTPSPKSSDLTPDQEAECGKIDLLAAVKGHWLKDFDKPAEATDQSLVEDVDLDDLIPSKD